MTNQKFYQNHSEQKKKERSGNFQSEQTLRETPSQQGPGKTGYRKPNYNEWTKQEMLEHAQKLGLNVDEDTSLPRLIELLEQASSLH